MLHSQVYLLLDGGVFSAQTADLSLDLGQRYRNELILPLLRLDLLSLVALLVLQVLNVGLDSVRLIFVLLLQGQQTLELVLVPGELLLPLDDPLIVVELILLVSRLVLQQL